MYVYTHYIMGIYISIHIIYICNIYNINYVPATEEQTKPAPMELWQKMTYSRCVPK